MNGAKIHRWQRVGSLLLARVVCLLMVVSAGLVGQVAAAETSTTLIEQALNEQGGYSCLSPAEAELVTRLNDYRAEKHLPRIGNSRLLNMVARAHAIDLAEHRPELATDARGLDCNLHSWSNQGFWTPFCYTADHFYKERMFDKPREITRQRYRADGYENVYWSSAQDTAPERVLGVWQKSPQHNAMLLEQGIWHDSHWVALGVGIYKNVAIIWVGAMPDPLGSLPVCTPPPVSVKILSVQ